MTGLIIFIHLVVCFALIIIVLLQSGKGASMGAMFGGAGNQTLFGNTGASTFLTKATTAAAVIFMLTSLTLAYVTKDIGTSVLSGYKPAQQGSIPVKMPIKPGQNNAAGAKATLPGAGATAKGSAPAAESATKQSAPAPAKDTAASAGSPAQAVPTSSADAKPK